MKQNKLVLVVLVVIVVLFVAGLGMGLFHDEENDENGMTMSQARAQKNGWVATLQGWMSPLDKKLDLRRLIPLNNCKIDQSTHQLTLTRGKPKCSFNIAEQDGDAVQKAVLAVKTGNVKLQVSYPKDKACTTSTRGPGVSLKKFKQPRAKIGQSKIKPGVIQGGAVISTKLLTLDVIYKPAGTDGQYKLCEVTGNIDLAVLEKGGTLSLECEECKEKNRSVTVALE